MEKVLEFFKEFNIQTILALFFIVWYYTRDIKSEMKILEAKIDKQSYRSDRLYEMFIDLLKDKK